MIKLPFLASAEIFLFVERDNAKSNSPRVTSPLAQTCRNLDATGLNSASDPENKASINTPRFQFGMDWTRTSVLESFRQRVDTPES